MTTPFDFDPLEDWAEADSESFDQVRPNSPANSKFQLFVKVREVKQLAKILQEVKLKDTKQKQAWLQENEAIIAKMVDTFTDDSLAQLQGLTADQETVKLSVALITELRQSLLLLDSLLLETKSKPGSKLKSV
jgi:hypothetical protein